MRLICIDDVTDILSFGDGRKELTWGKEYEVRYKYRQSERTQISIVNDLGIINDYLLSRFVTVGEFKQTLREEKFKELGL